LLRREECRDARGCRRVRGGDRRRLHHRRVRVQEVEYLSSGFYHVFVAEPEGPLHAEVKLGEPRRTYVAGATRLMVSLPCNELNPGSMGQPTVGPEFAQVAPAAKAGATPMLRWDRPTPSWRRWKWCAPDIRC